MRNEETILKAKEQAEEIQTIKEQFSDWEEWEASEEQVAYEEEHCDDDDYEWPVDEDEICFYIYELCSKMIGTLEVYINNDKTGEHQAKRAFKEHLREIRSIRKEVNKVIEDREKYLALMGKLEDISRSYL